MEKLPIVYESLIGTLFLVKNVGSQTLLMAPNMNLTTLDVGDKNWTNLEEYFPDNDGSCFNYLCMTGEKVCSEDLIVPFLKMADMSEEEDVLKNARQLRHWGVESDMEPVTLNLNLVSERERIGQKSYKLFGSGVCLSRNPTTECTADVIGYSLLYAAKTGFFPSIKVSIRGIKKEDITAAEEVLEKVCEIVQGEEIIKMVDCV